MSTPPETPLSVAVAPEPTDGALPTRQSAAGTDESGTGANASPSAKTTVRLYRPGEEVCTHPMPERIDELLVDEECFIWVEITDPGAEEMALLGREFGFHRLALEDAAKQRQRTKLDEYGDYLYLVLYAPAAKRGRRSVYLEELDVFVGRNYVVTLCNGRVPALEEAVRRWDHLAPELRRGAGGLLHTIGDCVIDAYFPVIDRLEDQLDEMELGLFRNAPRFEARRLLEVKRSLFTLRRAIYPLREVFNTLLRRDSKLFPPEIYPYLQDTYDHVLRLLDTIDIERDMATGVLDAQLSVTSNRLNETMKRLTAIAVCVAVMGAVFGAWGMNFSTVPGAHLGLLGFGLVALGAIGIAALTLLLGRWLKWW